MESHGTEAPSTQSLWSPLRLQVGKLAWRCTFKCPSAVGMAGKADGLGRSPPVHCDWVLSGEHPHGSWLYDAGQHQQAHQVGGDEEPQGAQGSDKVGGLADVGCNQGRDTNGGH